ncbi:gephyrin-like molybdotransferase Glp [Rhodococcus sp. IEGM 1408]|uniref:molybdotransferase-like divisome protein Glp n=1 Tax=Rhodococcus sp. IEGM 1408 TaxID=3082220 RepID=UPI0029553471|nr:gephyrin-like molybdotransferase Glp [Rhodococcus sp. IEGM 1408]MDV8001115.1 molybdopterin molybdotransferase MoeA [Rhodococcus sp. IEGM 1408]
MRSVEEQLALVTASAVAPRPVRVSISEAQGLLCAEEVVAERPLPSFDQAAIDGYAVRSVDVRVGTSLGEAADPPAAPVTLPVVGKITAGSRQPTRLQPGQSVRVDTGAPLPTLADAVLPVGWATTEGQRITPTRPVRSGEYVRRVGDDVQPGDVAVRAGSIIGPAQVGLLASVGRAKVLVHPKPRMSVISVGDELLDVDGQPGTGQVYDVNSYALTAAGRDAGADVHRVGIASTEPSRLREVLEGQLVRSELVVVSGAAGGEATTRIRQVMEELGQIEVNRVAMHPGSVQGFGRLGRDEVPTFLLPSNPVSALVVFEIMVRPLIRIALGKRQPMRRTVRARTVAPISSVEGRRGYLRGQLMRDTDTGEYLVRALGGAQGSSTHLLASLAEANCLVVVDPDVTAVRAGGEVDVMFLAQRG